VEEPPLWESSGGGEARCSLVGQGLDPAGPTGGSVRVSAHDVCRDSKARRQGSAPTWGLGSLSPLEVDVKGLGSFKQGGPSPLKLIGRQSTLLPIPSPSAPPSLPNLLRLLTLVIGLPFVEVMPVTPVPGRQVTMLP
jgi:hypothetical protein